MVTIRLSVVMLQLVDNLCKALHFKTKENLDEMSAMKLVVIFASFKIKTGVLSIIHLHQNPSFDLEGGNYLI